MVFINQITTGGRRIVGVQLDRAGRLADFCDGYRISGIMPKMALTKSDLEFH